MSDAASQITAVPDPKPDEEPKSLLELSQQLTEILTVRSELEEKKDMHLRQIEEVDAKLSESEDLVLAVQEEMKAQMGGKRRRRKTRPTTAASSKSSSPTPAALNLKGLVLGCLKGRRTEWLTARETFEAIKASGAKRTSVAACLSHLSSDAKIERKPNDRKTTGPGARAAWLYKHKS